jgi:hypothetical protein
VQVDDDDLIGFIDFLADTKGTQVRQIEDGPCLGDQGRTKCNGHFPLSG